MAQDYQVTQVSPETRSFETKFGPMVSYKVKLEGVDEVVELAQKTDTSAPAAGDTLYGSIDTSGSFGPKFKKERRDQFGGGFGSTSSGFSSGAGKPAGASKPGFNSDPFTMYLSYAKDIAVAPAMFNAKGEFNAELYGAVLEEVTMGAKTLYNSRPGAETADELGLTPKDHAEALSMFDKPANQDTKPDDTIDLS